MSLSGFLSKVLNWTIRGIWLLFRILLIAWATLAIYYSNLPSAELRVALATSFAVSAIWLLWVSRDRRAPVVFVVLFLGVVGWWLSISPSHDRPWRPDVAVMPRATIDGDRVRITGVRNFEYRSLTDFTARWEEREVQLSHLTSVDFFVSFFCVPLERGTGWPYLPQLHLRQCPTLEHLYRDAARSGRKLQSCRLPLQAI